MSSCYSVEIVEFYRLIIVIKIYSYTVSTVVFPLDFIKFHLLLLNAQYRFRSESHLKTEIPET